jgi:hypothetical protein
MNSMKCPECGLVNWTTATECKRCHAPFSSEDASFASEPEYLQPQSFPEQQKKQALFSGGVVFLTGILIVSAAIFVLQQAFHLFDPDTAKGIGGLLGLVGILFMVLTHIWLLIRIFEQSIGWGLASLFLPICCWIAVGQFWEKTKRSFVGQMVCVGIVFVGIGVGL